MNLSFGFYLMFLVSSEGEKCVFLNPLNVSLNETLDVKKTSDLNELN